MISLRYYRHYLWIFFYLFFILMIVAMAFDFHHEIKGNDAASKKLVRFLNVLTCFAFSSISVLLHQYSTKKILGINTFGFHRKTGYKRYMKLKSRKSPKKVYKKVHLAPMIFLNVFSNMIALIPVMVVAILIFAGVGSSIESAIFKKEFFCAALLIKYIAWYVTLIVTRFSIFFNKKRLRNLV